MPFRRRPRYRTRRKTARFEGWWQVAPTSPFPNVRGKIEWDEFDTGDSEIQLFVSVPGLPDGAEMVVRWGNVVVTTVLARGEVIKQDLETKEGDAVPRLAHEQVELVHEGAVIATTRLEPD